MLRRVVTVVLLGLLVSIGSMVTLTAPAAAQSVVCAEYDDSNTCVLELDINLEGDPSTVTASVAGGGGGVQVSCDRSGLPIDDWVPTTRCQHGLYGWYSRTYDCYFRLSGAAPEDEGVILPSGYQPGDDGAVYSAMCIYDSHPDIPEAQYCYDCVPPNWFGEPHLVFLTSEPDGFGGTPDPVPGLLVQAIEELTLQGPTIGTAPPTGATGLVRLPVWVWNEVSGYNWGTPSETASDGGISVVAQATAVEISWAFGDGTTQTCDEGVAWQPGMPVHGPPCGHTYLRSSREQPGGRYGISATTLWTLEWFTEGLTPQRGGEFELDATSTDSIQVQELQVLYGYP